jgi:serine/threonine-protein kinase
VVDAVRAALAKRYAIERELESGGMATLYLARDLKHQRAVVVKVLKPKLPAAVGPARFLREIRITAQLNHPHILPLLDSGEAGRLSFHVMPHVSGGSLEGLADKLAAPVRHRALPDVPDRDGENGGTR